MDGKELSKEEYLDQMRKEAGVSNSDEEFDGEWSDSSEDEERRFKEDKSYSLEEFKDKFQKDYDNVTHIMLKNFGSKKWFRDILSDLYSDLMDCDGVEFDTHTIYLDGNEEDENDDGLINYLLEKYGFNVPSGEELQKEVIGFYIYKYNITNEDEFNRIMDEIDNSPKEVKPKKTERTCLQLDINFAKVIQSYC